MTRNKKSDQKKEWAKRKKVDEELLENKTWEILRLKRRRIKPSAKKNRIEPVTLRGTKWRHGSRKRPNLPFRWAL
jgi:hypothetical protein